MHVLGIPIGEIASLLGVVGIVSGGVMWLFKLAIITPLSSDIQSLNSNLKLLTKQLNKNEQAHETLNEKVDLLELDIAKQFAKNDEFVASVKRRLDNLESKERSSKNEKFF